MIRINLLPYRAARSKENIRRQISIFLLSLVLLIVILIVFNGHLGKKKAELNQASDGLKIEVTKYEAKAKQVEELKKKLDNLNKQIEIVKQLKAYRDKPPKLLAKMTEMIVPERMQLTRLFSEDTDLTIEGLAMDNETIAVFMERLERSGLFSDVDLASSKQIKKYDVNMKEFSIDCKKIASKNKASAKDKKKAKK